MKTALADLFQVFDESIGPRRQVFLDIASYDCQLLMIVFFSQPSGPVSNLSETLPVSGVRRQQWVRS
jgi:hypothetical protein